MEAGKTLAPVCVAAVLGACSPRSGARPTPAEPVDVASTQGIDAEHVVDGEDLDASTTFDANERDGEPGVDAGDDFDEGTVDVAQGPDASGGGDAMPSPDASTCPAGEGLCPTTAFNSEPPSAYRCRRLVGGACPAPDLIVVRWLILDDGSGHAVDLVQRSFGARSPELLEGCVHAPGMRRLLRFNFAGANQGTENMNVGRPDERDPLHWEFNTAHGHFHVRSWADYRVISMDGREVGYGHKQSFCLEDNIRLSDRSGPRQFPPPLCAEFNPRTPYEMRPEFGLSVGWGDEYPTTVPCQWVDLGTVDPSAPDYVRDGFYRVVLTINPAGPSGHLYRELDYGNNSLEVRVEIRGDTARGCADNAGDSCAGGVVQCDGVSCGAP